MHEIHCDCGELVATGEIRNNTRVSRTTGNPHSHAAFVLEGRVRGIIIKNGSENPKKWTGLCSRCQAKEKENAH